MLLSGGQIHTPGSAEPSGLTIRSSESKDSDSVGSLMVHLGMITAVDQTGQTCAI